MAVLYGMPIIQYSALSARFCKLNDLHIFIHLSSVITDMPRDSIVDRHYLYQRYVVPYAVNSRPTSQKIWGGFLYGVFRPGNDFELIPTVKMETRHPVEGSFGNEFSSVYNHCGVMAAWSRKTLKKIIVAFFFEKRPLTCVQISCNLADRNR